MATCRPCARTATPACMIRSSTWQTASQAVLAGARAGLFIMSSLVVQDHSARRCAFLRRGGAGLPALANMHDVLVGGSIVDQRTEAAQRLLVLQGPGPFAFIAIHQRLHLRFQFGGQAQAVLDHDLLQVVKSAFEAFTP